MNASQGLDYKGYPPFLEPQIPDLPADQCLFHVIPVPLEATVSYGHGTARGPAAILNASSQLEDFNGFDRSCSMGIHTQRPVNCRGSSEKILKNIENAVSAVLKIGRLPVILGGEHSVSVGAFRALRRKGVDFGIVHFDAHGDLRESYRGSKYSHGCVMNWALGLGIPLCQLGVRSISCSEFPIRKKGRVIAHDAMDLAWKRRPSRLLPAGFPKRIYVSFDVDALDASLMPATGTPEPGGLMWWDAMALLKQVIQGRSVAGFDVVELAPIPGMHAPDFTAARLTYNIMGLITRYARKR